MVSGGGPWSVRGGSQGDRASSGVFNFATNNGNANGNHSFRLVCDYKRKRYFVESIPWHIQPKQSTKELLP